HAHTTCRGKDCPRMDPAPALAGSTCPCSGWRPRAPARFHAARHPFGLGKRPALSRPSLPAAARRSPGDDRDRPGFWMGWQTGPDSSPPGGPRATGLLGDCSCLPHSSRSHPRVLLLISVVQEHVKVMELCLHDTRSHLRDDFLSLANRFAEFCGRLNQDQRRYADAERWTSKALDFAQALDDVHLMSYTLMRRSNIATETGRGHDALLLAEAALHPRPLTPGLRAVALRQKAAALALLGDEAGYRQAVDDGLDAAGRH